MVERNLKFYMANLGSEVSRYFSYSEKGQNDLAEKCFERVQDIIGKMMLLPEAKKRILELSLIPNILDDFKEKSKKYDIKKDSLKNYFLPFAERVLS